MSQKEEVPELKNKEVSVARYKKKKTKRKTEKGTVPEQLANERTEDITVLSFSLVDSAVKQSEIIDFPIHTHSSIWRM